MGEETKASVKLLKDTVWVFTPQTRSIITLDSICYSIISTVTWKELSFHMYLLAIWNLEPSGISTRKLETLLYNCMIAIDSSR